MLSKFRSEVAWLGWPLRGSLLAIAMLIFLIAGNSSSIGGIAGLERLVFDARGLAASSVEERDERIVLVVFTEETLLSIGQRSPLDRAYIAEAVRNLDQMNPRSITIDVLLDQPTENDAELLETLRMARSPLFLGWTDAAASSEWAGIQSEYLNEVFRNLEGAVEKANIALSVDSDYIVRNWPSVPEGGTPAIAGRLAELSTGSREFAEYSGPIVFRRAAYGGDEFDTSLPSPSFAAVDIGLFIDMDPMVLEFVSEQIEGKHVLIGADLDGIDRIDVPAGWARSDNLPGTEVLANMLSQALDGKTRSSLPSWINFAPAFAWLIAGLAIGIGFTRTAMGIGVLVAAALALVACVFILEMVTQSTGNLGLVGWLLALGTGYALAIVVQRAATAEKGRTATLALHKYLPAEIADSIVTQPDKLGLEGETRDVYVMFTDLEGFTSLCQSVPAANVAEFLNEYLEEVSQIVLDHGGTIDKFVGDAVVAFWGAPVAHKDDAERITKAALAIKRATDAYKGRDIGSDHLVGRTRIGVHFGSAIVGNFGGEGRLQYTALGDTMNVAARLEGANKELGTSILLSGEVYGQLVGAIPCRIMGQIHVRGRSQPVAIYEPDVEMEADTLARLNQLTTNALGGDAEALAQLADWAEANPQEIAMAGLVERIRAGA